RLNGITLPRSVPRYDCAVVKQCSIPARDFRAPCVSASCETCPHRRFGRLHDLDRSERKHDEFHGGEWAPYAPWSRGKCGKRLEISKRCRWPTGSRNDRVRLELLRQTALTTKAYVPTQASI